VNLQVSGPFLPPPQVVESTRSALSRWRHGFEPVGTTSRNAGTQEASPPLIWCRHGSGPRA
jgi:hypothetical protein